VLRSPDVKRITDWYVDVLDGHVIFDGFGMGFMTYDDEHHRLGFVPAPGEAAAPGTGPLAHLAYAWDSLPDLVETYARLRDKRIYPRITVNHGLTMSFYMSDPDGNGVELFTDLLPAKEATALMNSPAYQNNPVGLLLDPEELLAGVRAGEITAEKLTADFKSTKVDVPTELAKCHELQAMTDEEYVDHFESKLGARA
jgi:catechol 2,3-dioxygenase-like lactoylglutathione lyase family enzyme